MTTPTPAGTEPAPMPHPNADPDFAAARQAQAEFPAAVEAVRSHPVLSDLQRAEKVAEAHASYTAAVQAALDRVNARAKARHDWLAAQLPTGPGIPNDATHADRAALMAAFRGHYDKAVKLSPDDRAKMLDAADRFGDEPARRAALTAILERSEIHTLRDRNRYADLVAHIGEMTDLQHGGGVTYRSFARQAFTLAAAPLEVAQLPELREAEAEKLARWRAQGYRV